MKLKRNLHTSELRIFNQLFSISGLNISEVSFCLLPHLCDIFVLLFDCLCMDSHALSSRYYFHIKPAICRVIWRCACPNNAAPVTKPGIYLPSRRQIWDFKLCLLQTDGAPKMTASKRLPTKHFVVIKFWLLLPLPKLIFSLLVLVHWECLIFSFSGRSSHDLNSLCACTRVISYYYGTN